MQSVKTAISLQRSLFEEAESLAHKMKVSRSRLFALAFYANEPDLNQETLPAEYDFTGGVRGKHHRAMQSGCTMTIHQADGTTVVKEMKAPAGAVVLEPDVHEA